MAGAIRERAVLRGPEAAQALVLDVLREHADSLLRVARRHSLCSDDAQDAYQRSLEIFLRHAATLRADDAYKWVHTVVKHEAMRLREQRTRHVTADEVDLDGHVASRLPTADERVASFDLMTRSAEALQRLKPQELRALWLRAQGHSYHEIAEITQWTPTKVNRCLTEGRRSFLARYDDIATGAECRRWEAVLSAMVDGDASPKDLVGVRPHLRHCPACRAHVRALRESATGLAAVLPVPLMAAAPDHGGLLARAFEAAAGIQERVVVSATKLQAGVEASLGAKVAVVAASAAAIGGGGVALERATHAPARPASVEAAQPRSAPAPATIGRPAPDVPRALPSRAPRPATTVSRRETVRRTTRSEFGVGGTEASTASRSSSTASREFEQPVSSAPQASTASVAPIEAPPTASRNERTAAAEFGGG